MNDINNKMKTECEGVDSFKSGSVQDNAADSCERCVDS